MLQSIAISVLVVLMMVAIGLDLTVEDLRAGLRQRWALAIAGLINLVAVPAIVFALSRSMPAGVAVGLVMVAAAPGGPTGPLFARMARADLGFATSLQVLLALAGLVTAPLTLELLAGQSGERSLFLPMLATLVAFQLVPLAVGMLVRARKPDAAARMARPLGIVVNVLLLAIIVGLLTTRGQILLQQTLAFHGLLIGLVLVPLAVAIAWPRDPDRAKAIGMVTTVRNLSVALLLSATFYTDPEVDAAILCWGFYMMALPAGIAAWLGRRDGDASG